MSIHAYKEIISKAQTIKTNVEKTYAIGLTLKWGYYFAKAITNPGKDVTILTIKDPSEPSGTSISRQIDKDDYLKKVDEIIKTTYGDTLKDYRIGDDGPFYEIFSGNKLELLIPIGIETVTFPNGFGETIALELN